MKRMVSKSERNTKRTKKKKRGLDVELNSEPAQKKKRGAGLSRTDCLLNHLHRTARRLNTTVVPARHQ